MSESEQSARTWLRENGYRETAEMIEEIIKEWQRFGKKTHRNWWDVLAGDRNGNPRRVEGRLFPVYNAARQRQGLAPIAHAVDERKKALQEQELTHWAVPIKQLQKEVTIMDKIKKILGMK